MFSASSHCSGCFLATNFWPEELAIIPETAPACLPAKLEVCQGKQKLEACNFQETEVNLRLMRRRVLIMGRGRAQVTERLITESMSYEE